MNRMSLLRPGVIKHKPTNQPLIIYLPYCCFQGKLAQLKEASEMGANTLEEPSYAESWTHYGSRKDLLIEELEVGSISL